MAPRRTILTLALILAAFPLGCTDSGPADSSLTAPSGPQASAAWRSITALVLSPDSTTLSPGGVQQFSTVGLTSSGGTVPARVTYSATGGTITSDGLYTAGSVAGTYQVISRLRWGNRADTATVTITSVTAAPSAAARVTVTPPADTLSGVGSAVQLTAHAYDAAGVELTGQTFIWSSSNASVATVNASGLVTAAGAGTATITATDGGVKGSALTTVVVQSGSSSSSYSTNFPLNENPISEGGHWVNGQTNGLDWKDVYTLSGVAHGVDGGTSYADPTAILTGQWPADQHASATIVDDPTTHGTSAEVEIRLRSVIGPHLNRGYEVLFGLNSQSVQCVRWNGALGDFYSLGDTSAAVKNGDVVAAEIVGSTIKAYINGQLVAQWTDGVWTDGAPGLGFNYEAGHAGYGVRSFSAGTGAF